MKDLISILPVRQCFRCERWTTLAFSDGEHDVPVCAYHGFNPAPVFRRATDEEKRAERASVERFVVACHDNMGRGRVVAEIDVRDVPGWLTEDKEMVYWYPDRAWRVWHGKRDKQHRMGFVVWSYLAQSFYWIRDKSRTRMSEDKISERQEEQAS